MRDDKVRSRNMRREETVILLHGLGANRLFLRPLANHFSNRGFHTENWGYPSVRLGVEESGRRLRQFLQQYDERENSGRIHIVAHSMGSIVTRAALLEYQPRNLGRVVLLAPPNRGSPVARRLAPALGSVCPALRDLSDAPNSFVNRLPDPAVEQLGIIAAAYDRVVPLQNTHLGNELDHTVLPFGHGSLLFQWETAATIECFLERGSFCQPCLEFAP